MLFGCPKEPTEGFIDAVTIYPDRVVYSVIAWMNHEKGTFHLSPYEFDVIPQEGLKPLRVGFSLTREQQ